MNPFKDAENSPKGAAIDLATGLANIKFDSQGLVPAIAQQYDSKEILMLAWMNLESLRETLNTGRVCYWSRSRQKLWRKGESSGQVQILKSLAVDCDGDTLLLTVDQTGPACHTGRKSCFFYEVRDNQFVVNSDVLIDPKTLYKQS